MYKVIHAIYGSLFLVYVVLAFLIGVPLILVGALFHKDKQEFLHRASKLWFKNFIIPLSGMRVEIEGLKNIPGSPVIYVSNHQSMVDIGVLLAYLPGSFRFIVKREYLKTPLFGWYTVWAGHLPIDRAEGISAHRTLGKATQLLKEGKSIIIFPEGTRSRNGRLQRFKRGSLMLAFRTRIPIVPIGISGSFKVLPPGSLLINPAGGIKVAIAKPILFEYKEMKKKDYQEALDKVRNVIARLIET